MIKELQRKFIKTTMLVVTILLVVFLVSVNLVNDSLTGRENRLALDEIVNRNLRSGPGTPEPDAMSDGVREHTAVKAGSENRGQIPQSGRYFIARTDEAGTVVFSDLTHDPDMDYDEMIALINKADVPFAAVAASETETENARSAPLDTVPQGGMDGIEPVMDERGVPGAVPPPDGAGMSAGLLLTEGERTFGKSAGEEGTATPLQERGSVDGYLYCALQQPDRSVSYAFLDISRETEAMIRILLITAALGAALWLLVLLLVIFLSGRAIAPIAENMEKQRQFITNAGHEFKTPLAVIVSNVDVQELHGGKTKWLDNIRSQALRLSDLTKQMLTLAKMEEAGNNALTSSTFDASLVLEETVNAFRESASVRGISIQTEIESGILLYFSKEQYRQMLELLLDNAVKYGRENGFLSVTLHAERKMAVLSFKNDCDQLPDAAPDQLFDRFYRPDSSRNRKTGGSGIGLAVVRAIAGQGGGSARAQYHPDQVIEFRIELMRKL